MPESGRALSRHRDDYSHMRPRIRQLAQKRVHGRSYRSSGASLQRSEITGEKGGKVCQPREGAAVPRGVSFHHEYDKINSNITDAINVLQADLGTVNLAQNRKILDYLEQSKIMDMMATLEALQDKTDQAEGNRSHGIAIAGRVWQKRARVADTRLEGRRLEVADGKASATG